MGKHDKLERSEPPGAAPSTEDSLEALDRAQWAIDSAFSTGRADRAEITRDARSSAKEAVRMVDAAMEADEMADDAMRMCVIAEKSGNRDNARNARKRERAARKQANAEHKAATKAAKAAYNAIKFSAPNKLGFMRVIQVAFVLHIASTLLALIMTSRDTIVYDSLTIADWASVILEAVAFWFFVNRYKVARPLVMGIAAFNIVVPSAINYLTGHFSWMPALGNSFYYLFLILYFAFSVRVKATLVNDFGKNHGAFRPGEVVIVRHGWPFVRNLIIYFIVFSVLGHWMEAGMCQFIRLGWVQGEYDPTNTMLWRDWFYPYPMEGAAVVIIALVLYPMWKWMLEKFKRPVFGYVLSFFANALTCSLIEFSMGLVVNANHQLWDYSDNFGNIMGQVCLQNALAFGVAASLIAWFVYPMMERWLARVPDYAMNIVFVVIAVIGGILWSLYIIDPPDLGPVQSVEVQEDAGGLDEIRNSVHFERIATDSLQSDLNETNEKVLDQQKREEMQSRVTDIYRNIDEMEGLVGKVR